MQRGWLVRLVFSEVVAFPGKCGSIATCRQTQGGAVGSHTCLAGGSIDTLYILDLFMQVLYFVEMFANIL